MAQMITAIKSTRITKCSALSVMDFKNFVYVKVDIHKKPVGNVGATETVTTASVTASASEAGGGNVENNHRRFSNLSNLAQSLPSNR